MRVKCLHRLCCLGTWEPFLFVILCPGRTGGSLVLPGSGGTDLSRPDAPVAWGIGIPEQSQSGLAESQYSSIFVENSRISLPRTCSQMNVKTGC